MVAQTDFIWVVAATLLFCMMILALVMYVMHHNKTEIGVKLREHEATQEKRDLEHRLEEANRMMIIGALAGGMAYYLNHTMFACNNLIGMLRNQLDGKQNIQHLAGLINEEIQRGLTVTDKLQQLALPTEVSFRPFNIAQLVQTVVENFHHGLIDDIALEKSLEDSGIILVHGNETLIRQALLNLLVNAVDAMPEKGVLHIGTSCRIDHEENTEGTPASVPIDMLEIRITDSGIGMDDATRDRIFEPFFTTKNKNDRLGLGLSFVYGVMKLHNGQVDIESTERRGTSVKLILPTLASDQVRAYQEQEHSPEADYLTLEDQILLARQQVGKA
ncbi:nitrogen regulation protein NR(II) [Candidatus Neomarinimicrobiota bacterium]